MSCVMPTLLPRLAAISGLPVERLGQMADAARRKPLPPLPLDPAVVDAMAAGLPASHDPQQVAAVLQAVAQGLRLALRQLRDRPPDPRVLALLAALTGTALPDAPAPDPSRVQSVRANLCLRPAPLPLELPTDPDAQRRAVLAAAPMVPWTDDEADQIAPYPTLAGLAWALGVRHPRIRTVIDESLEAVVAAISEGVTDSGLLQRVVTNDLSDYQVVQVLVARQDLTDPALIAKAAERPDTAAEVLAASSRTDPALIAAAAQEPETAAHVLVKRQNLADPALIARASESPWAATRVLANRRDIADARLLNKAAAYAVTAAEVLVARQDITDPDLITRVAARAEAAAQVLAARRDITDPDLIRAAAEKPETAARVLANRQDIADPALIARAAKRPDTAAEVLVARQDLTDPTLRRSAAESVTTAARVLANRQDIADPAFIAKAAESVTTAAQVLAARRDITTPDLIRAAAGRSDTAAQVLAARQDLADPDLIARAAKRPETAATVLANRQDIADPDLIAKAAVWPSTAARVLAARQDLRERRDVLDRVCSDRGVAHAVVDALGPYPALWDALPAPLRDEIAVRYRMTPSERAWLAELAIRTPPAWTEADDQMAARFPWHATLRASLRTAEPA